MRLWKKCSSMFTKINNQNIYYQKVGKGKDLILLHGWGADVSSFWPVVDFLKNDFTLWLLDLPGFGRSDPPKQTWSVEDYADTVVKFIRDCKIKGPVVLGHSFGGSVAIKLAAKYPNLISKLILEASSGIRPRFSLSNRFSIILAKIIKFGLPNLLNVKDRLRFRFYKLIGSDYLTTGVLKKTFVKIIRQDLTEDAKKIPHQTLIVWGEDDKTLPLKRGKKLYQLIENSKLEIIEDCGHVPHITQTQKFVNLVKDFCL